VRKIPPKNREQLQKFPLNLKLLKVIPFNCIAHPFCARFFAQLACARARACSELDRFSMTIELVREINGRFLLIEHGDTHFLLYKLNQDSVPKAK